MGLSYKVFQNTISQSASSSILQTFSSVTSGTTSSWSSLYPIVRYSSLIYTVPSGRVAKVLIPNFSFFNSFSFSVSASYRSSGSIGHYSLLYSWNNPTVIVGGSDIFSALPISSGPATSFSLQGPQNYNYTYGYGALTETFSISTVTLTQSSLSTFSNFSVLIQPSNYYNLQAGSAHGLYSFGSNGATGAPGQSLSNPSPLFWLLNAGDSIAMQFSTNYIASGTEPGYTSESMSLNTTVTGGLSVNYAFYVIEESSS